MFKIFRILIAVLACSCLMNCVSNKNRPANINSKEDFKKFILERKPISGNYSDTVSIVKHYEGIKLNAEAEEILGLKKLEFPYKTAKFVEKININPNFISLIISLKKSSSLDTFLINYDKNLNLIDKLLIFEDVDGNTYISSGFRGNRIDKTEIHIDGREVIGWEYFVDDDGKIKNRY